MEQILQQIKSYLILVFSLLQGQAARTVAVQGGQGPAWQSSTQAWVQGSPLLRPHTSPQECGTRPSFRFHSGFRSFRQKQRYSEGAVGVTAWQPGHLQPPDSVRAVLAHFFIQTRWNI